MGIKLSLTELQQAADQCVKCAVCLPHCPTYALSREEAESPRGRITLLQGIVHERLEPTADVHKHLSSCLNCGRCEQVCPANVPYTRLLDGTRLHIAKDPELSSAQVPKLSRRLANSLTRPRLLKVIGLLGKIGGQLGAHRLLGSSLGARLLNSLPNGSPRVAKVPSPPRHSSALLFTGCLSNSLEQQSAAAARTLIAAYGIQVDRESEGLCCGALFQHQADERSLLRAATTAVKALRSDREVPIIALQSGCGRGLKDGLKFLDHPDSDTTAERIVDVFDLLLDSPTVPTFRSSADSVALYAPCSVNRQDVSRYQTLVERDVGVSVANVAPGMGCCGAAGDHMLTRPSRADQLAAPIVDDILHHQYTHILTPNVGCAWHLRANLRARGASTVVEHPITWMARHLAR